MGRLAPWAKYNIEWEDIAEERQRRALVDRRSDNTSTLAFQSSSTARRPEAGWISKQLSSLLLSSSRRLRGFSDQTQCLLFTLPPEVRLKIWAYALGGHDVKIVRKVNKLGHGVLPRDSQRLQDGRKVTTNHNWTSFLIAPSGYEKRYQPREVLAEESFLPLLQCCKRAYPEVVAVLYGQNTLEFETIEAFYRFLSISPAAGLQSLSRLHIKWHGFVHWPRGESEESECLEYSESWSEICGAVMGMSSLRELTLSRWQGLPDGWRGQTLRDSNLLTVLKIVSPLKGLAERVAFRFLVVEDGAAATKSCQDWLQSKGCTNVQIVGITRQDSDRDENWY